MNSKWNSTIGKKFIMGAQRLAAHRLPHHPPGGQLDDFHPRRRPLLNTYSHTLHKLGPAAARRPDHLGGAFYWPHRQRDLGDVVKTARARSAPLRDVRHPKAGRPRCPWLPAGWPLPGLSSWSSSRCTSACSRLAPTMKPSSTASPCGTFTACRRAVQGTGRSPSTPPSCCFCCCTWATASGARCSLWALSTSACFRCHVHHGLVLATLVAAGFFVLPIYTYFFIPLP